LPVGEAQHPTSVEIDLSTEEVFSKEIGTEATVREVCLLSLPDLVLEVVRWSSW
jgi:hypothetical protein